MLKLEAHSFAWALWFCSSAWVDDKVVVTLSKFDWTAPQFWVVYCSSIILSINYWLFWLKSLTSSEPSFREVTAYSKLEFLSFNINILDWDSVNCILSEFKSLLQLSTWDWSLFLSWSNFSWFCYLFWRVDYKLSIVLLKFNKALFWVSSWEIWFLSWGIVAISRAYPDLSFYNIWLSFLNFWFSYWA